MNANDHNLRFFEFKTIVHCDHFGAVAYTLKSIHAIKWLWIIPSRGIHRLEINLHHKLRMSIAIWFSQHKVEYNKIILAKMLREIYMGFAMASGMNERYLHLLSCRSRTIIMKLNQCYLLAAIAINSSKTGADEAKHNRKMQNWKIKCFAPTLWCSNNNIVLWTDRRRDGNGGWRQYCALFSKHILWYKMRRTASGST